ASVERGETVDDDFGQGLEVDAAATASTGAAPAARESDPDGDGYPPGNRRRRRRRRRSGTGGTSGGGQQQGGPRPQTPQQHQGSRNRNRNRRAVGDWERPRSAPPQGGGESLGVIEGVLELHPKGYGFLRDPSNNYSGKESDPFVSSTFIEKNGLREGVMVRGEIGSGAKGQGPRLRSIESIDGRTIEDYQQIKQFDELTPINPFEPIRLERGSEPVTMRVMDLLTPIGKGQRALLVSPPRSGKTMLLQDIADSVSVNHPEVHLIVLLIDERPEEVTEMRRRVKGEVVASSLDREVESHIRVSQLVIERAKRLAEEGKDVFILLDSITRLARAFNKWVNNSGRTGTGGLDIRALDIPKKLFGTARRFEEGGSLTVVGTALIETGGRMDDAIFQEFKGTGNMELVLSRELADRRIWPAIDIAQSGTRREEKLLSPEVLEGVTLLRRSLISLSPVQAMEDLVRTLRKFPSNKEFLARVQQVM
ncbi:MAG: transcription termination factor Rho, partial [Planctomycetaceae bacterium]